MTTPSTAARRRRIAVVTAALAMLLLAQLAGPRAGIADDVAGPAEAVACETAPIDELRYAEAAADPGDDVPVPDPIPYVAPVGTVAGADTIGRVEALLGQVVTCVNAGRNGAFLSLFTSDFLERHIGDFGDEPDDRNATPVAEEMRLSLVRVADVTVLGDGRVAALVVFDPAEREAPELTSLLTFQQLAGQLLIDAWQPVTLAADTVATPVAGTWEMVSGLGYTGVIVPLDRAPIVRTGYGDAASGWWLPTAEQIARLEAGLPNYLLTFSDEQTVALADKVGTYERQYAGLVVEGRALVFVNAFCEDPTGGRWTAEPVFVDDGGDCFFQVYYEPSTGGFRELSINGEG